MAKQAYFQYSIDGLTAKFRDLSVNPISWFWEFGDGENSSEQNPIHMYEKEGFYEVKLIVNFTDDIPEQTETMKLAVNETRTPLPMNIHQLVEIALPKDFEYPKDVIDIKIKEWQMFLSILVTPEVPSTEIFNEFAYEPLVNMLISYLVAYDIILDEAQKYLISTNNQGQGGTQPIKKITEGPADAEWFNGSESLYNMFKSGGLVTILQQRICMIAARLRITLQYCKPLDHNNFDIIIAK